MSYTLGVYLNFFSVVAMSAIIGWVSGHFSDTMIAMIGFGVLRVCSGGFHLKSLTSCAIVSAALFGIIPFIHTSSGIVVCLNIVTVVIVSIFSPTFRHFPILENRKRLNFKIFSTILVVVNLFIVSAPLALAYFAQSLTLIHTRGGEQE